MHRARRTIHASRLVSGTGPEGPVFLARFRPLDDERQLPTEGQLELLHVEQRRAGRASTSTQKVSPSPTVRIDLGSIASRLASKVQSRHMGAAQGRWAPSLSARHLETGTYTLRLGAHGFDDVVEVHTLEEGPNELACTMHRDALAVGWIAGTVRTDSGAAPAHEWVVYVHFDGPAHHATS